MTLSGCGTAAAPSFFSPSKKFVSSAPVLSLFNSKLLGTVSVDASSYGLGAVLLQAGQPIEFASRSLTDTQCRYAQIEKELLAVQFGVTHFHHHVYGKNWSQAPGWIRGKANWILFPRIHRMRLQLQVYSYQLLYKPRKELRHMGRISRR